MLVAAGLAATTFPQVPSRSETWLRVRTANFTLYGNAPESKIKEVGLEMEKLRAVLVASKNGEARTPVPTFVFAFRDLSDLDPYRATYHGKPRKMAALFLQGHDGNFVALPASWNLDQRPFVYHEYLHDFMRSNFLPQPLWYEEGLAEFYSTIRVNDSEARVGLVIEGHIRRLRDGFLIPLDRLFAVEHASAEYNEEERQGLFYAESWAVVHYLMRGNRSRTPQLGRFLVALQQGRPRDEAFRESFQTDYATLESEVRSYMAGRRFPYFVTKFSDLKIPRETRTERMNYAETLVQLGELLARISEERIPDAERFFRSALAEKPDCAGALAGIGELRLWQKMDEEAIENLRKAVATGSADFRAWFNYGWALLQQLAKEPVIRGRLTANQRRSIEEARESLRKSLELESGFAEARGALGRTYLYEDAEHLEDGISALEATVRLLPSRTDLALDLATLYERKKDIGNREEIRRTALGPDAAAAASRKPKTPLEEGLDRVNALLQEHREDEAIALLEQLLAAAPEDVRRAFDAQSAQLRRGAAKNRSVRQYNEAVALAKKEDFEGALAGFKKVAETSEDADLARAARKEAERITEFLRNRARRTGSKGR